jgi:hypothetical protein
MQKSTVIILSTCLLSAVGVGAYELGTHKPTSDLSTYSVHTQPAPLVPATSYNQPAATPTALPGPIPTNRLTGSSTVPVYDPPLNTMPLQTSATRTATSTTTAANTALSPETPMAVLPPVPGNQYAEQSTVTETKTVNAPAPHRVYVHHYTRYRRHDKVHVARAVKHTGMFALKLPGRMSL